MKTIEERLQDIEERNVRVEQDKAWEGSLARIFTISAITYIVAVVLLCAMKASHPFLNALVPVLGFILSTQSLPFIKKIWTKKK